MMSQNLSVQNSGFGLFQSQKLLDASIKGWAISALVGQWFFTLYILAAFALPLVQGGMLNVDTSHMIRGVVPGDEAGNIMVFAHILPAALLSFCGILQLIPYIRIRFPAFHKYNGRLFLVLGLLGALTGFYLTWVKGTRLSDVGALGLNLNGLLIPVAVFYAWKYAIERQFAMHMRWAIHAFILVNGVWFFRLFLMGWFAVHQGPFGNSATLDGPADIGLSFASFLLPMLIAEVYFWGRGQKQTAKRVATLAFVMTGFAVTTIGVLATIAFMWWPKIALLF